MESLSVELGYGKITPKDDLLRQQYRQLGNEKNAIMLLLKA